jgi:NitT/TauT family transport system substrate-binding protein
MAALPILSNAAYYLGVDKGFFYKQGLDPIIQQVPSPAAALASLQGGNTDFGFTTVVTMFTARDAGVPVKFVAPAAGIRPKAYEKFLAKVPGYTTDTTAILVMPSSGITRPKDLAGKTVAIPARNDQSEITIAETVRQDGGDAKSIRWVPMAIPDGVNALVAGKVDAAFGVDPLNDKAVGQGAKVLAYPGLVAFKEGTTSGWGATDSYVKANQDTVARFQCAIRESNQYANDHPLEVKAKSAELTKTPFENLKMSVVPRYYSTVSLQDLSRIGDFMYNLGYLKNKPKYAMSILTP